MAGSWERITVGDFDLRLTLESGQFFRYYTEHGHYLILTQRRALRVRQEGNIIHFTGASADFVQRLFGLGTEHDHAMRRLRADPALAPLLEAYPGLRLMRQDLHETIIGFICSTQSNIPKIRMNLHHLAHSCGPLIDGHAHLPPAGTLLDETLVRNAKTGYRAKYLVQANRALQRRLLDDIRNADYETSHLLLCSLPGVGPKVADCICLFALGHGRAFPVDVHIMRAMRARFPRARLESERRIREFAQKRWGEAAGLAQQYLYQWARDTLARKRAGEIA